jgi:hypothetical protein
MYPFGILFQLLTQVKMANQALLVVLLVSQTLSKTGCILLKHLPTPCTQIVHALCKHPSHFVDLPSSLESEVETECQMDTYIDTFVL